MKFALVTGATSGLGLEITKALAKTNWYVFACGRNDKALEKLNDYDNICPLKMDVTTQDSIDDAYIKVTKETNHIDAIINFSGVQKLASLIEGDIEGVRKILDVNLFGMMRINKTFFPLVYKCGGRIINCSSECGWMTPQPFNGPYTLSKYAVEAYNDSLRRELMFLKVPVIKIQPGSFKTAMHGATMKSFEYLVNNTKYYKETLEKMKGLMEFELKSANDPKYLVKAVLHAANSPNPKQKYRVKNSVLLGLVEGMHPITVDRMYKRILG